MFSPSAKQKRPFTFLFGNLAYFILRKALTLYPLKFNYKLNILPGLLFGNEVGFGAVFAKSLKSLTRPG